MARQEHYWRAFYRLKNDKPIVLPKGSKVNLDNVAMEAGRKRGAIKRSRRSQNEIVAAIDNSSIQISNSHRNLVRKLGNESRRALDYKSQYHKLLNHTIMLNNKIKEQEEIIAKFNRV